MVLFFCFPKFRNILEDGFFMEAWKGAGTAVKSRQANMLPILVMLISYHLDNKDTLHV